MLRRFVEWIYGLLNKKTKRQIIETMNEEIEDLKILLGKLQDELEELNEEVNEEKE